VAMLARNGEASERLQAALREAGADVVLVSDPAQTDAPSVRAAGAQALLIALEPAVEDALDRFDTLLADPDVTVIFDEAELAAQRKGWDAARWTRHLAAKLNRHEQVLPPGADVDESIIAAALAGEPEPLAIYQRPESDGDISAFATEADGRSDEVPRDFDNVTPSAASMFDPVLAEMQTGFDAEAPFDPEAPFGLTDLELPTFAAEGPATAESREWAADETAGEVAYAIEEGQPDGAAAGSSAMFENLAEMQFSTADLKLSPQARASSGAGDTGAVVVLGGIGGPDAVRQFLSAVPAGFPRPIVIQQRLDGGQHEKLVRQMQRATSLPVHLAEVDASLQAGHIYILPPRLAPEPHEGELTFRQNDDGQPAFLRLPPADTAVIMLSGSDPSAVDAAMTHAWGGAIVAGQSAEGCFDAAASDALLARGARLAAPAELAKQLSLRWLSLE
jgi:chemosensory pili system protein ChpB (putative protein-glutamate methylesterase)